MGLSEQPRRQEGLDLALPTSEALANGLSPILSAVLATDCSCLQECSLDIPESEQKCCMLRLCFIGSDSTLCASFPLPQQAQAELSGSLVAEAVMASSSRKRRSCCRRLYTCPCKLDVDSFVLRYYPTLLLNLIIGPAAEGSCFKSVGLGRLQSNIKIKLTYIHKQERLRQAYLINLQML